MTAIWFSPPSKALDPDASPYSGAIWYFYQKETLTPLNVYSDTDLSTSLGAFVTADSAGKFPNIYFNAALAYRAVCKSADGAVTLHDIPWVNPASGDAGSVGYDGDDTFATGTVGKEIQNINLGRPWTPYDGFGAVDDYQVQFVTGTMTAAGSILTLGSALPVGVTAGMRIFVDGAGANGEQLITGIASVNAGRTQLTLDDPAVRAITSKSLILEYGTDNYAALQALADYCYENNQPGYIPPGSNGVWLTSDTIEFRQSLDAETNVREAQMLGVRIDPGATIKWASATGTGKAVVRYGAGDSYDQLLRGGHIHGGEIDCSFVAETGVAVPFALDTCLHGFQVKDVAVNGFKIGDNSALTNTGAVTLINPRVIRSTLGRGLTITSITKAAEAVITVVDHNWDDGRIITIEGSILTEANNKFFKITRLTQDTFKLVGVDSTGWSGTFSGTATATACMPTMRQSWAMSAATKANPCVVTLTQSPAEADGARMEFHAVGGMVELEGITACIKAVVGQPTKYELYTDAGLTTGVNSSAYTTYTGNGFMTGYVDPDTMEVGARLENCVDIRLISPRFRGVRLGVSGMGANSAGYSTTIIDQHFHNYNQDGSMYVHCWLGGKNRIVAPYIDGPTKYGFIWEGAYNDIFGQQHFHNPGSAWYGRDNFPITHRTQSGSAAVRVWGGVQEGGASNRIYADHIGSGTHSWDGLDHLNVSSYADGNLIPRNDPRTYGALQPLNAPSVSWAIDNSATAIVLAQSGTYDLQAGSGIIGVTETQATGFSALLIAGNGAVKVVGNSAAAEVVFKNTLTPGAGEVGFAVSSNRIRITNNYGSQVTICLSGVRTRATI